MGSLALDGHDLSVTSSDKPPSVVYVHYFPAEGNDALICDELSKYGEVSIRVFREFRAFLPIVRARPRKGHPKYVYVALLLTIESIFAFAVDR